ncbi:MAG: glycosyltransferase family 2 protein [Actinobacteria bacterium]|nr:MAG: glycosyltransferase family 2 protein [Actinomycetota bacterium]
MTHSTAGVVVSYADATATRAAVGSLLRQTAPLEEVIVVDNARDERLETGAWDKRVRVLRPGRNLGYGPACNLAAAATQADWLLFCNPDAKADERCLELLLAAADERTAIVGAQVLLPGARAVNAGDNPLHLSGLSWSGRFGEPREDGPPRDVAVASGAALLVRRAAFEQLGGYHPSCFLYYDDVDLAWRARLAGWRVRFQPAAVVEHDFSFERGAMKWYWLERNRLWSVLANYSARALVLLAPLLLVTELAILGFAVRRRWWREKLRAYAALWRARHQLRQWRAHVQRLRRVADRELLRAATADLDLRLAGLRRPGPLPAVLERYKSAVVALLPG